MAGGLNNFLGARFATEAPSTGAGNGTRNEHGRSLRRRTPAPATAAATAASAAIRSEAADIPADGQPLGDVQVGAGGAGLAGAVILTTAKAFYGLYFSFAMACVSPTRFHSRDGGRRVTKGVCISSSRNAAKASGAEKEKLVLLEAPDYATSDHFKKCAAEDGLHELVSHVFLQFSKTRLFGINGSLTAEMLGKHSWADELGGSAHPA